MSAWSEFIEQQRSTDDRDGAIGLVALQHQQLLDLSGPDSEKFLQGQVSCDVREVQALGSGLGSHCNIKGHMIGLFRLLRKEDGFWLRLHQDLHEVTLKALSKYIIFSKATLKEAPTFQGVGIFGSHAREWLSQLGLTAPQQNNEITTLNGMTLVKVAGERYELWGSEEQLLECFQSLPEPPMFQSLNQWLLKEIAAGLADLREQTIESFIPQMVNLQAVGGVSFSKGCYTGQEIITRLQHRGKLNRPMYRVFVATSTLPEAGSQIDSAEKQGVGTVVFAARRDDGIEMLAVIHKEQAEKQKLHLHDHPEDTLEILHLPYTLDPRLFERKM